MVASTKASSIRNANLAERRLSSICVIELTISRAHKGWFWYLDFPENDRLNGPFVTENEAFKDIRETLGLSYDPGFV